MNRFVSRVASYLTKFQGQGQTAHRGIKLVTGTSAGLVLASIVAGANFRTVSATEAVGGLLPAEQGKRRESTDRSNATQAPPNKPNSIIPAAPSGTTAKDKETSNRAQQDNASPKPKESQDDKTSTAPQKPKSTMTTMYHNSTNSTASHEPSPNSGHVPTQVGRIVVFVDGSDESELAFRSALRCKRHDDVLYVVNYASSHTSVPPLSYDADVSDLEATVSEQKGHEACRRVLNHFQRMIPSNEPNVVFVSDSTLDPASAAIEFAKNEHATLIVLGSRCHSTIGRVLLGSFTSYVTNHSPCDVYVVRPQDDDRPKLLPDPKRAIERIGMKAIEAVKDKIMSTATTLNFNHPYPKAHAQWYSDRHT